MIKCEHVATLPPGYDERTRIALSPGGRVIIAHPEQPVRYLDGKNWLRPLDFNAEVVGPCQ